MIISALPAKGRGLLCPHLDALLAWTPYDFPPERAEQSVPKACPRGPQTISKSRGHCKCTADVTIVQLQDRDAFKIRTLEH